MTAIEYGSLAAFISSRLDYCNSLLYGLQDTLIEELLLTYLQKAEISDTVWAIDADSVGTSELKHPWVKII